MTANARQTRRSEVDYALTIVEIRRAVRDQLQIEKRIDAELLRAEHYSSGDESERATANEAWHKAHILAWVLEIENRPLWLRQRMEDIKERQRQVKGQKGTRNG